MSDPPSLAVTDDGEKAMSTMVRVPGSPPVSGAVVSPPAGGVVV